MNAIGVLVVTNYQGEYHGMKATSLLPPFFKCLFPFTPFYICVGM
jgi:hypothetical protein